MTVLIPGGSIDSQLGKDHEDFARLPHDSVDLGGGSIDSQLGKDP